MNYLAEAIQGREREGVIGFYFPQTAKVMQRRDLSLKSYPKDWKSPESN